MRTGIKTKIILSFSNSDEFKEKKLLYDNV